MCIRLTRSVIETHTVIIVEGEGRWGKTKTSILSVPVRERKRE